MYQTILFKISKKIFEEAAFAIVDPCEDDSPQLSEPSKAAHVEFNGTFSGRLAILATERTAQIAAANMLGLEEDDPDVNGKAADALGEILNMICGNFLPAVAGSDAEFQIDAPTELNAAAFPELLDSGASMNSVVAEFCVEGDIVKIIFLYEKGALSGELL